MVERVYSVSQVTREVGSYARGTSIRENRPIKVAVRGKIGGYVPGRGNHYLISASIENAPAGRGDYLFQSFYDGEDTRIKSPEDSTIVSHASNLESEIGKSNPDLKTVIEVKDSSQVIVVGTEPVISAYLKSKPQAN